GEDETMVVRTSPADEPPQTARARTHNLEVRRLLREAQIELLRKSLANHGLLTNLAQAERDYWSARLAALRPQLDELKSAAQQKREARAQAAREQAEQLKARAAELPPALREVADSNTRYREELERVVHNEQRVGERLQRSARELEDIKADYERIRQRVDVVGSSVAIGNTLRKRRAALPSLQSYRRDTLARGEQISVATNRQMEIDDLLRGAGTFEQQVIDAANQWVEGLPVEQREALLADAQELVAARRASLNELQQVYGRYMTRLTSLDVAERELVTVAESYADYIDEKLLWMPSVGLVSLFGAPASAWGLWLGDFDNWSGAADDLARAAQQRPLVLLALVVVLAALALFNRGTPARLHGIDLAVRKIRSDSAMLTLRALVLLVLRVAPAPLVMIAAAWLLRESASTQAFTLALADALTKAALIIATLALIREMAQDESVGDRHLGWPARMRKMLRKYLRWLTPFAALSVFAIVATAGTEPPLAAQAGGSLAFVLLMVAVVVVCMRLLGEHGAIRDELRTAWHGKWIGQLHFLWYPLVLAVPLALALVSLSGYHYTAVHMGERLTLTLWLFLALFLGKELILRWLFVTERRLRFDDALRRRDELRVQRAREGDTSEDTLPPIPLDVPEVNYDSLSEQSKRLVRVGFLFAALFGTWSIWSDLIPALGFLNSTELPFEASRMIDGVATLVPVTLGDFVIGLFIIVVTVLAAKNLPGILEISLLQRLPLDAGARYAITALSQYLIAGIGLIVAFKTMGLHWSGLQWLVAALGVGLGFGLQEIVANFVSGIILLFERPIRVGDTVTIDGTTGVVTKIRIRATTITNYDKQELVVPNKEFITGRLINWTLTDKMNRVMITVGLAYGADVDRAMALMQEAALENPDVLNDPTPLVSFEGFGDNALTLVLRTYLANLDNRLAVITALHRAINQKFNAAGLSIAYPQRDIHVFASQPLDIRLHQADGAGAKAASRPATAPEAPTRTQPR
ncbi:MAG TPA: mechanosensitive ion channel, partial [Rhodocyclaceae bacterium]|nr:mechanosensitive ion channel [Rhodocyclaceae bacterium]